MSIYYAKGLAKEDFRDSKTPEISSYRGLGEPRTTRGHSRLSSIPLRSKTLDKAAVTLT